MIFAAAARFSAEGSREDFRGGARGGAPGRGEGELCGAPAFAEAADQFFSHFAGGVVEGLALAELEIGVEEDGGGALDGSLGEEVAGVGLLEGEIDVHDEFEFAGAEVVVAGAAQLAAGEGADGAAEEGIGALGVGAGV